MAEKPACWDTQGAPLVLWVAFNSPSSSLRAYHMKCMGACILVKPLGEARFWHSPSTPLQAHQTGLHKSACYAGRLYDLVLGAMAS